MKNLTNKECLIYFAGLIDGEGHIGCQYYGKRKRPVIQLNMTHEGIVKAFADFFNIKHKMLTSPSRLKKYEQGYKLQYQARVECAKAYPIIKALQPYLIVKEEEAKEALSYYEDRPCEICKEPIPYTRNTNSKTCSDECYREYKRIKSKEYRDKKKEGAN